MRGVQRWVTVTQLREDQAEGIDYVAHHRGRVAVARHLQMVAVLVNPGEFDALVRAAGRS